MKKKVNIPRSASGLIVLARDILKKHKNLGENSPLKEEVAAVLEKTYNLSKELNDLQAELARKSHFTTDQRNRTVGIGKYMTDTSTLYRQILAIKRILEGSHMDDPRALSEYGFDVDTYHKTLLQRQNNANNNNNSVNHANPG